MWSGHAHHQAHVVLDQQHGDAQARADVADQPAEVRRVPRGSGPPPARRAAAAWGRRPARGRVRCASGCRTGDRRRGRCANGVSARYSMIWSARWRNRVSSAPTLGRRSALATKPVAGARMRADHDVVAHRQAPEHRQVLERAPHAQRGDAVGRQVGDRLTLEQDVAPLVAVHRDRQLNSVVLPAR